MKHYIIGRGNLGLDLVQALTEAGHETCLLTSSGGWNWRSNKEQLLDADFVWIAAGFGSVEHTNRDPLGAFDTHVVMPIEIAKGLRPETRLICFSSDYAADESAPWSPGSTSKNPRSVYAVTKISMELALRAIHRKNTFAVRIGSLYGSHLPQKTFPSRLLERYPNPCNVTLPMNRTTPTPTKWIADVMSRNLGKFNGDFRVFHCAPQGMTPVWIWGQIILGGGYKVESHGFDQSRPLCSNLQCSFEAAPDWLELWKLHSLQQKYHAQKPIHPTPHELPKG
jgi:dTDP-4-dehydrorhamnose reductase